MAKRKDDPRSQHERMHDFLKAYANCLHLQRAAEVARVSRDCHYVWYRKSQGYRTAFEKAREYAGHYLETYAIERAGEGWLEPVYYQGVPCGEVRRFDSGLMQFLLRGLMPEKYGAKTEISGPAGTPMQAKIEVVFVKPGDTNGSNR